jgi:hypothetical protein
MQIPNHSSMAEWRLDVVQAGPLAEVRDAEALRLPAQVIEASDAFAVLHVAYACRACPALCSLSATGIPASLRTRTCCSRDRVWSSCGRIAAP